MQCDMVIFKLAFYCFVVLKEEDEEMIDFSRHYTGIVIGVACAAIFAILSIITFSHTRRRLQERRHGSLTQSGGRQISYSDNDIFQQNAPPTYDDGKNLAIVLSKANIYELKKTLKRKLIVNFASLSNKMVGNQYTKFQLYLISCVQPLTQGRV